MKEPLGASREFLPVFEQKVVAIVAELLFFQFFDSSLKPSLSIREPDPKSLVLSDPVKINVVSEALPIFDSILWWNLYLWR